LGYERVLKKIKALAPRWVALGGGGYNISNVARAWTLAWAVMNGIELEEDLPDSFLKEAEKKGIEERELRGRLRTPLHSQTKENRAEMERVVCYIKENVFPKVKG
jgi:acetoin utilization protein AcuC